MRLTVSVQGERAPSFSGGRELAAALRDVAESVERALDTQAGVEACQAGDAAGQGWMIGLNATWEYEP